MVDFAMDVHKSLYPDQEVPATLVEKRAQVVEQFKQLQSGTDSVLKIMTEPEVTKQTQQCRDSKQLLEFLMKNFDFKPSMVDTCYHFAKFQYECGNMMMPANDCLQYHTASTGTIATFNWDTSTTTVASSQHHLSSQYYDICIRRTRSYCS